MSEQKYASWNPWHGCTKYSEGCRYCYVYRQDEAYGNPVSSEQCRKTQNFSLPVKKKRDGTLKIAPGSVVMTCFTSDFLLKDADEWRDECWKMIKCRNDCMFYFFTKRIERFLECAPADWGNGYHNVIVGCTCETRIGRISGCRSSRSFRSGIKRLSSVRCLARSILRSI